MLDCLYSKTADEIIAATGGPIWPCLNEYEITQQPIDLLRLGKCWVFFVLFCIAFFNFGMLFLFVLFCFFKYQLYSIYI